MRFVAVGERGNPPPYRNSRPPNRDFRLTGHSGRNSSVIWSQWYPCTDTQTGENLQPQRLIPLSQSSDSPVMPVLVTGFHGSPGQARR